MQNDILTSLTHLADGDLVARVKALLASERGLTAVVIAHLAELDTRDVHLREGYPSLYLYCRDVSRLSEWEAYNRIEVARSARQFPLILDMLEDGSINLTAVRLLGPHLTPDNHIEVLAAARGKRKPEIQQIVASLAPRADVPASVRRLPARSTAAPSPGPPRSAMETAASSEARKDILDPGPLAGSASALSASGDGQSPATGDDAALSRRASLPQPSSGVVVPLSPDRYKLQVTISGETLEKLRLATDMLGHRVPSGDHAVVLDRALDTLLAELAKRKFAATTRPGDARESKPGRRSPSAAVKRVVWRRDLGRCAFVGTGGHRCEEHRFLEFHHVDPYALGGEATVDGIQLRCRQHNDYEGRLYFGERRPRRRAAGDRELVPEQVGSSVSRST
jgi:hypothetical protein